MIKPVKLCTINTMDQPKSLKPQVQEIMKKLSQIVVLPNGQQGLVVQPSSHRSNNESYGWDQAFAAIIFAELGMMQESSLVLREMAAKVDLAGYQPLVTRWYSKRHNPFWNARTKEDHRFTVLTQQPLLGQTALILADKFGLQDKDPQLLKQASAAALVNVSYLLQKRRLSTWQLVSVIDPQETGMTHLSVWDEYLSGLTPGWISKNWRIFQGSRFINFGYISKSWDMNKILADPNTFMVESVSFNVFMVRELLAIARLHELLGESDQAEFIRQQGEKLAAEIDVELWDPHDRAYYPKARFTDNQWRFLKRLSIESLWPLLLPALPIKRVEELVILIEEKFQSHYLLPVSPPDPSHSKKVQGKVADWWPGQVWANTNRFFIDALRHHSKRLRKDGKKETADLAEQLADRIDHDWDELITRSGMREYYDQEGSSESEKDSFWSALKIAKFPTELR